MTRITDEAVDAAVAAFDNEAERQGAVDDVDGQFRDTLRAAIAAALPHLEGAIPAIDRDSLRAEERQRVAQSIRDEAVDEAVDGFVQLTAVIRMCEEAGR